MTEKSALDLLRTKLTQLRERLSANADTAYGERDATGASESAQAYAAGESHAYGVASDEVRAALADPDGSAGQTGAGSPRRSG